MSTPNKNFSDPDRELQKVRNAEARGDERSASVHWNIYETMLEKYNPALHDSIFSGNDSSQDVESITEKE
jgi:hypothetical protein